MKYLIILTVGICLLFASIPATADQAEDEAVIKKVFKEYLSAFNTHDTTLIGAFHDVTFEHWKGIYKGKDGAQKSHEDMFSRQKDWRIEVVDEIGLVFVTPDAAIYKLRCQTTGIVDGNGNRLPPIKFLQAVVYVKRDNQWLRAATFSRDIEE